MRPIPRRHGLARYWRRTLQVGTMGIGTAVALKAYCQPETPESWRRRRTFTLAPNEMQALDAERRALEIIADAAGLTLDQLRSVLHSNWCGMELIAEVIAAAPESDKRRLAEEAVERARRQNFLPAAADVEDVVASSRPRPETRRTYGVDVGGSAPLYVERARESFNLKEALRQLQEEGLVVLKALQLPSIGRPVREVPSREVLALGCSTPLEPSAGRRHFLLRGTDFAEQVVVPLLAPIMPLCYRYFCENRPDASPGSLLNDGDNKLRPARLYLSECQLLVSDPGAVNQMWHCDNLNPGLTVILPLTEVDDELGPTHLLPGTHLFPGCSF